MLPYGSNASWKCRRCSGLKHYSEYSIVNKVTNARDTLCNECKRIYYISRQNSPHGIASKMFNSMNARAGNRYNRHSTYADVEVKFTRQDWLDWAKPRIATFFREHPGERPSVDRIDFRGHYSFSNIRIIPWSQHRKLKKAVRWERYVKYLSENPEKLQAFVNRHSDKIIKETDPSSILRSVETLLGHSLSVSERNTLDMALAHPELLLNLMYLIDNARCLRYI